MTPFSETLRRLRTSRRLRQKELARQLNLDSSSICQVENGYRNPLSEKQLDQLCELMDLSLEEETQLRIDARISNPIRKVPTDVGREKLLVLDALIVRLDVLTEDQVALIKRILEMKIDRSSRNRVNDTVNEQRRNIM